MSGGGAHSVRVDVATRDLIRYCNHLDRRRLGQIGQRLLYHAPFLLLFVIFVLPLLIGGRTLLPGGIREILLGIAGFLLVGSLARPLALHQLHSFARRPAAYDMCAIGLEWRNDAGQGVTHWECIVGIEETGDLLLLHLRGAGAHIIPKRSFATPEAAQQFLDTARNYWQAAKEIE